MFVKCCGGMSGLLLILMFVSVSTIPTDAGIGFLLRLTPMMLGTKTRSLKMTHSVLYISGRCANYAFVVFIKFEKNVFRVCSF